MEKELRYEWNLSYRIEHWVRVIAIAVLVFTGFYIHRPFIAGGPGSFLMTWMKFFHSVAAYALVLGLVIRIYMAFNSTFKKDWEEFRLRNLKNFPEMIGYYLFIKGSHREYKKYNPLEALEYLFFGALIVFAAFTGAALYKGMAFGFINAEASFRWVNTLLGGESYTRIWHFLTMWVFIIFAGVHVYMALLQSAVNKDRTFMSIFTGYKLKKKAS